MENKTYWRIINKTNGNVKIAVSSTNNATRGVILHPGQFCIANPQMTSSIDAQSRRSFVEVEEGFKNEDNLNLAESYDLSKLEIAKIEAEGYLKSSTTGEIPKF